MRLQESWENSLGRDVFGHEKARRWLMPRRAKSLILKEWAREELNLRPHAYQARQPVLENRHRDGLSLRRSSIRRLSADIDAELLNAERDH